MRARPAPAAARCRTPRHGRRAPCRADARSSPRSPQRGGAAGPYRRRARRRQQRAGRPSVSVPVLSKATVPIRPARSSVSMSRIRMPARAAEPVPATSAVGVGEAERAGAGDDQHRDRRGEAACRIAKSEPPDEEGACGDHEDDRHEDRGDAVDQLLDRRLAGLCLLDQPRHAGKPRIARRRW